MECVGDSRARLMTTKEEERQHRAEMREETSAARQRDTGIGTRPAVGAPHPAWQPGYCGEDYHYVKGLLLNTAQMCLGNQRFNLLRKCLILQRIEICG